MEGMRVAVAGMGVSGLGLARVLKRRGAAPVVFDQKPGDNPAVLAAVDELDSLQVEAVTGWHGRLDPIDFDLLIVSPGFPREHPAIRDMQRGGRPVWSEVEYASRIAKAPIVAFTGTNGKSTTTVMAWTLVESTGRRAVLCGNIAGSGYEETTLTEAADRAGLDDVLVAEVSSYHLEWTEAFRPRVAAVTNVTPDHMDRYKSFQDYFDTKLRIFGGLDLGDSAVVNLDQPYLSRDVVAGALRSGSKASIRGFSPSGSIEGTGETARLGARLRLGSVEVQVGELPLFGEHNVTNAMMAWEAVACVAPLEGAGIEALKGFRGLANRMERLGSKGNVQVINNSMCTNPAAVIASSKSVGGRQHLLMGGHTKGLDFAPAGEYLASTHHRVYVFGPEPERMVSMLGHDMPTYANMEEAFHAALSAAVSGDVVMLAPGCASTYPYSNFRERGDAFRSMALEWLRS